MDIDDDVLVTGGCGSIGSAVVGHLLYGDRAPSVTVYDSDEQGLVSLDQELGTDGRDVDVALGNVRDLDRLQVAMDGADYVIHTAGLKQVPHSETHPAEAMETNAVGTRNVLRAARRADVESVLTLSTDKAVAPTSTMGATKLLAERLTQAAHGRSSHEGPRLGCVRLGNVVGSAGSVVPLFRRQIRAGGPVTITEPEMTRFVMSTRQAASFVVECARDQRGGTIQAPKLDRLRVVDLAEAMIEEHAPAGTDPDQIRIERIGRRPGERPVEYLVGPTEVERTVERDGRYCIRSPRALCGRTSGIDAPADLPADGYRSDVEPFLDRDEIRELIAGDEAVSPTTAAGEVVPIVGSDDPH